MIANAACYSFRDLVAHERTGLLVTTDAELAGAMARLTGDPASARAMGEAGFAVVQQQYTWSHVADAVAAVLMPEETDVAAPRPVLEVVEAE